MVDAVEYTTYLWSLSFMHGEFVLPDNIKTHNKNTDNKKRNIDLFKLRSAGHVRGDWSKERNMDQ